MLADPAIDVDDEWKTLCRDLNEMFSHAFAIFQLCGNRNKSSQNPVQITIIQVPNRTNHDRGAAQSRKSLNTIGKAETFMRKTNPAFPSALEGKNLTEKFGTATPSVLKELIENYSARENKFAVIPKVIA